MGEYFSWVNLDKKEYLCPNDFDLGNKIYETSSIGKCFLNALYDLLSERWKDNRICWMGDECFVSNPISNSVLQELSCQMISFNQSNIVFDMVHEKYRNVSCLFKEAEQNVRDEIEFYLAMKKEKDNFLVNEYGINEVDCYHGLFQKTGKRFPYVVNHTKKEFYQLNDKNDFYDPLPALMVYDKSCTVGEWLGDIVEPTNDIPNGYSLIKRNREYFND